jgi:XapX domain-containing protein
MTTIFSLLVGIAIGVIFGLLKLPVPVPEALAGLLGIVGMWLGFALVNYLK